MLVGIIGYGVIGKAVHRAIQDEHHVKIYDPAYPELESDIDITKMLAVFICVPTPTKKGAFDGSYIEKVLTNLTDVDYKGDVFIRSTILPELATILINYYRNLSISVTPEFLNQHNPYEPQFNVIGTKSVESFRLFKSIIKSSEFKMTTPETASMIKYVHNCFGALKVTFFNEVFDICETNGINYREMVRLLLSVNNNVGKQYTDIGLDGKRGFGGACFPKDIVSFYNNYRSVVLGAAVVKNRFYRKDEMKKVEEE